MARKHTVTKINTNGKTGREARYDVGCNVCEWFRTDLIKSHADAMASDHKHTAAKYGWDSK